MNPLHFFRRMHQVQNDKYLGYPLRSKLSFFKVNDKSFADLLIISDFLSNATFNTISKFYPNCAKNVTSPYSTLPLIIVYLMSA